ncbi:MAG TPA: restriction endonuclease [archaeon]|nr:restriction endonuclease [archaeon]
MFVTKADGSREEFSAEKIIRTCMRVGVSRQKAEEIEKKIEAIISEGISTHKIYAMINDELDRINTKSSLLFSLRDAIANLDSVSFEIYAGKILSAHGYSCRWNVLIKGEYVEHQVDIIAKKGSEMFLVECKKHFNPHRFCGLGVLLQVNSRLEDIQSGFKKNKNKINFTGCWIFNNTKFSEHAKQYANGKNIRLTGWHYRNEIALEKMIESKKIYPITALKCDISIHRKLMASRIVCVQDLLSANQKTLNSIGVKKVVLKQAKDLLK